MKNRKGDLQKQQDPVLADHAQNCDDAVVIQPQLLYICYLASKIHNICQFDVMCWFRVVKHLFLALWIHRFFTQAPLSPDRCQVERPPPSLQVTSNFLVFYGLSHGTTLKKKGVAVFQGRSKWAQPSHLFLAAKQCNSSSKFPLNDLL